MKSGSQSFQAEGVQTCQCQCQCRGRCWSGTRHRAGSQGSSGGAGLTEANTCPEMVHRLEAREMSGHVVEGPVLCGWPLVTLRPEEVERAWQLWPRTRSSQTPPHTLSVCPRPVLPPAPSTNSYLKSRPLTQLLWLVLVLLAKCQ